MAGSAVRNRSMIVTVPTPRGPIEVARQEMRGLRRASGWSLLWIARRAGRTDWSEATTPQEAIRRATLLPPKKPPAWLTAAAADAQQQIEAQAK